MRKILLVITKSEIGGAGVFLLNLATGLKNSGFQVEVVIGNDKKDFLPQELKKENINYYRFKHLKKSHNPFEIIFLIKEAKKFFQKKDFDVVHLNSSNSLPIAIGSKINKIERKIIFTFHGLSMLDENYKKTNLLKIFYKLYFKFFLFFTDRFVFVSKSNLELVKKIKLIGKKEKIKQNVIYNGLSEEKLNFLEKEKARKELLHNKFENNFIIGSIARLDWAKNFEFLINVFPKILKIKPNAIFILIGEGQEREKYEKLIREQKMEEKIILLGEKPQAYKYLKIFDLFLITSRYEGMPIVLIESVFADIPILSSNVGGIPEILDSETNQIFKLNDEKDFLKKFEKLTNSKNLKKAIEENKKQKQKFYLKNMIKKYIKIYMN